MHFYQHTMPPEFRRLFQLIILVVLLSRCRPEHKTSLVDMAPDFRTISVDTNSSLLNVSALAKQLEYIPIETTEQDYIGKVDKVAFYDDRFFLLDSRISKCLFVIGRTGKMLYHKRAAEAGDQKFRSITDFAIDRRNRLLYVYDGDARKVFCFDETNGEFRNSFSVNAYFLGLLPTDNGGMALYRDGMNAYKDEYGDRICLFGPDFKFRKSWLDRPINPYVSAGQMISTESTDGKRGLFARMFCDTVFSLQHDSLAAVLRVDAGKSSASPELRSVKDQDAFMAIMKNENTSYIFNNIFETRRYIAFYYKIKNSVCLVLTDKSSNRTTAVKGLKNDIDNTMLPLFGYMDDSCFVGMLTAADLQQQFHLLSRDPAFQTKFKKLIALNNAITADSNPVLIFGSLK
jgi:hypothetical protein